MPAIQGVPIGALFAMARASARRERIDEYRHATMVAASERRMEEEAAAREEGLSRMRAISQTQMMSQLTGSRLPVGISVPPREAGVSRSSVSPFIPQLVSSGSMG